MTDTCIRCGLSDDFPGITIGVYQCNYCDIHDSIEQETKGFDFERYVKRLRNKHREYDCLVGISGGMDSSILLYYTVVNLRLNPLVIHFDNGYNSEAAEHNMNLLVNFLNVTFIRYKLPVQTFEENCRDILMANVTDCDITNDLAMAKLMMKAADQYNIKVVFNGHDYKREGTCPTVWTYMDKKYYESLVKSKLFNGLSIWEQVYYSVKGIKHIRPLYFITDETRRVIMFHLEKMGFKYYAAKHNENYYTSFVGYHWLPVKFGIDKTKIYKAAFKRSGIDYTVQPYEFGDFDRVKFILPHAKKTLENGITENMRERYQRYDFRKYKALFWLLTKLRFFPKTFYIKYCK